MNVQGWAGHDQLFPRLEDEVRDAKVVGGHREGVRLPDGGKLQSQVRSVFTGEYLSLRILTGEYLQIFTSL